MPHVILSLSAESGIRRCRRFLLSKNPLAAKRAASEISRQIGQLKLLPESGRRFGKSETIRELVIPFGASGYLALYRYDKLQDTVTVLSFRHQLESAY